MSPHRSQMNSINFEQAVPINKVKIPKKLGPVNPSKRETSNSIDNESIGGSAFSSAHGYQSQTSSYLSHGVPTDSESSRFSSMNHYKYNGGNASPHNLHNNSTIQKIAPGGGVPRPNIHRNDHNQTEEPSMPSIIKRAEDYNSAAKH